MRNFFEGFSVVFGVFIGLGLVLLLIKELAYIIGMYSVSPEIAIVISIGIVLGTLVGILNVIAELD